MIDYKLDKEEQELLESIESGEEKHTFKKGYETLFQHHKRKKHNIKIKIDFVRTMCYNYLWNLYLMKKKIESYLNSVD
jgi:hypothetical protein